MIHGTPARSARTLTGMEPALRLDDPLLAAEIVLYGELVLAASETSGEVALSQTRIDRALGLGG